MSTPTRTAEGLRADEDGIGAVGVAAAGGCGGLPGTDACLSPRELGAWRGLLRVHASLVKALDAELEQTHRLQLTSYEVLLYLDGEPDGRMRMCDLAESVLLSRSGLTRLIDRLEREGLVARHSCQQDARGAYAGLTEAGREKLATVRPTHLAGVRAHFLAHFGEDEMDRLAGFWERVLPGASSGGCSSAS
ncbi:MAG TPA: MarR family transcriptional regulator [Solirubrobacteraceae bacterium]|jgi:DNA-binding MarR family transcriptional regulator|nr:MarR family transcriptional regulator [Solirubrobacteraceae bacterium]